MLIGFSRIPQLALMPLLKSIRKPMDKLDRAIASVSLLK
jgi:hypothetical protein